MKDQAGKVKVLAVGDPAVYTYTSREYGLVENWSRENGIEVDFAILPWSEYFPRLMDTLSAPESGFDIVMIPGHLWLEDFIARGYLKPLDEYISNLPASYNYEDLLPQVRKELEVDGSVYLVPSFTDGHIIFYNRRIIKESLGRTVPEVITTGEYSRLVKDLAEKFPDRPVTVMKAHESEIFLDWLPWFRDAGGSLFDSRMMPQVSGGQAEKALEAYLELKAFAPRNTGEYGNEEILKAIRNGEAVTAVSWGGQAGFIMEGDFEGKQDIGFSTFKNPWNVTWSFAVPAGAEITPRVKAFLAYLSSQDVDRIVGARAGSPVRSSSYSADSESYPWYRVQKLMTELSVPLPGFPGSSEVYGVMYSRLSAAFRGELTAGEALSLAESEMKEMLLTQQATINKKTI